MPVTTVVDCDCFMISTMVFTVAGSGTDQSSTGPDCLFSSMPVTTVHMPSSSSSTHTPRLVRRATFNHCNLEVTKSWTSSQRHVNDFNVNGSVLPVPLYRYVVSPGRPEVVDQTSRRRHRRRHRCCSPSLYCVPCTMTGMYQTGIIYRLFGIRIRIGILMMTPARPPSRL
jgi:hypothetical protein